MRIGLGMVETLGVTRVGPAVGGTVAVLVVCGCTSRWCLVWAEIGGLDMVRVVWRLDMSRGVLGCTGA